MKALWRPNSCNTIPLLSLLLPPSLSLVNVINLCLTVEVRSPCQVFPKCLGSNLSQVFMISPQLNSFLGSPLSKQSSQCWVNQTSPAQTGTSSHSPGLCYTRHQVPSVGLTRPLLHISFTRPLSLVIDLQQWTKKKKILPCSQREVL